MARAQKKLGVTLPSELVDGFFSRAPSGFKRSVLVAAALDYFLTAEPTEIREFIEQTASRYRIHPLEDERSKKNANVRVEVAALATKELEKRLGSRRHKPREAI